MKIGYIRVSDDDQTEALQIDALNAAGCEIVYGDHGISGAIAKRKGLDEVLAELGAGDTLFVWKLDRLGRSTVHLLLLLDDLRQRGVDFVSLTQGIDTTTSVGRMVYGQLAVFAEFEREQISERTKAALAAAKARGVELGKQGKILAAQNRAEAQQRAEALRPWVERAKASGCRSLADYGKFLTDNDCPTQNGGRWHPMSVKRVLDRLG